MRVQLRTAFCIMIAGCLFCGCGKSADQLLSEARSLAMEKETCGEAIGTAEEFLKRFPEDERRTEAYFIIAQAYQFKGDYTNAIKPMENIILEFPDSDDARKALFMIGYIYAENLADYIEAERAFRKFLAKYPDSEMAVSAQKMLDNLGKPIEEWDIFKKDM